MNMNLGGNGDVDSLGKQLSTQLIFPSMGTEVFLEASDLTGESEEVDDRELTMVARICCAHQIPGWEIRTYFKYNWRLKEEVAVKKFQKVFNTYVFKFKTKNDMERMLEKTPWIIKGYLVVMRQPPEEGFTADDIKLFQEEFFWIQLRHLPKDCFKVSAIEKIAINLGELIRIDPADGKPEVGKSVRVLMKMHVKKPLKETTRVYRNALSFFDIFCYNEIFPVSLCRICRIPDHKDDPCLSVRKPAQLKEMGALRQLRMVSETNLEVSKETSSKESAIRAITIGESSKNHVDNKEEAGEDEQRKFQSSGEVPSHGQYGLLRSGSGEMGKHVRSIGKDGKTLRVVDTQTFSQGPFVTNHSFFNQTYKQDQIIPLQNQNPYPNLSFPSYNQIMTRNFKAPLSYSDEGIRMLHTMNPDGSTTREIINMIQNLIDQNCALSPLSTTISSQNSTNSLTFSSSATYIQNPATTLTLNTNSQQSTQGGIQKSMDEDLLKSKDLNKSQIGTTWTRQKMKGTLLVGQEHKKDTKWVGETTGAESLKKRKDFIFEEELLKRKREKIQTLQTEHYFVELEGSYVSKGKQIGEEDFSDDITSWLNIEAENQEASSLE